MKVQVVYTKSCVYCPSTKALWKELQKKHKFDYEEIDAATPKGQEMVQKFSIMSVPTTIIDGKVEFIGMPNRAKAEEKVS
ncbi:thioredoxin family protein [archaeon]|nr:MAG: thioredoxin family protein [archaeon]